MNAGKTLQIILGLVLAVSVGTFVLFKTHDLLWGTKIEIDSPKNGATVSEAFVVIKGKAPESALLTINGAKVLTDRAGAFQNALVLGLGYNVISIESLDRFNRQSKLKVELVYRPREGATSTLSVALIK